MAEREVDLFKVAAIFSSEAIVVMPDVSSTDRAIESMPLPSEDWTQRVASISPNITEVLMSNRAEDGAILISYRTFKDGVVSIVTDENGVKKEVTKETTKVTENSIQIQTNDGSYFFYYDSVCNYRGEEHKNWSITKTNDKELGLYGEVQVDKTTRASEIILEDQVAEEWVIAKKYLDSLLSALPEDCDQKRKLENIWNSVNITPESDHMRAEIQAVQEKSNAVNEATMKRRKELDEARKLRVEKNRQNYEVIYKKITKKSLIQKLASRLAAPFRKWQDHERRLKKS